MISFLYRNAGRLPAGYARRAAALLAGILAVPAFAPIGWWPLLFVSLFMLARLWQHDDPRQMGIDGWWYGLGLFGTGASWVYVSMADFGGMHPLLAGLATLVFCAFLALFPALSGWLSAKLSRPGILRLVWTAPAVWTLMEWLRSTVLSGFPWLSLGYAHVPEGWLAGYAPVLGVYGLSWLSMMTAGAFVWLLQAAWSPRWVAPLALLFAVLAGGEALERIKWTVPAGQPVKVALLQGNVPQEMKWRPERAAQTLADYARMIEATDARLVVLPETALPVFHAQLPADYLEGLKSLMRARDADILAGVPTGDLQGDYYNSVVSFGASPEQFYHKRHLVAFGEYIPAGFGWIVNVLHIPLSDFARGARQQPPMAVAGQQVAVNICYEDAFGHEIIRALPEARLLVNVTNDAWFGDSLASWQHAQMAQMRALETGRYMLRATNTGVTAIIDEKGRVKSALPQFSQATLAGLAQGFQGLTPYARWGDFMVLGLMSVLLIGAVPIRRLQRV